ncbi:hypothetical protein CYY_005476 [Polysphondylium violaceum]|uniref:Cytochrome P450 family protein n=1 Tax=Polysphondylium violaceum TaxID=133409 RepID=A0A8J4PWB2_9MYCE|nr:hypothetical protein CYY_005476 [Polysphondylium violaceum]
MFIILTFVFIFYIFYSFIYKNVVYRQKVAIGPMPLPIIGNLNLIKSPHIDLTKLGEKYGKVFPLWFGDRYSMIINDPVVFRDTIVKNSMSFISRPKNISFSLVSYGHINILNSEYNQWNRNRGLLKQYFTNNALIKTLSPTVNTQVSTLLDILKRKEKLNEPFKPRFYLDRINMNIILGFVIGKDLGFDLGDPNIMKLNKSLQDTIRLVSLGSPGDYINILTPFYSTYFKLFGSAIDEADNFMSSVYDERRAKYHPDNETHDIMDVLIHALPDPKERKCIVFMCLDLFIAGADANSNLGEWLFAYLSENPMIQEKAYRELVSVFGENGFATSEKKQSTPYFNAVLKEVMRLKPSLALSIPREVTEDITINDVFYPKGTIVIPNIYSINRSAEYWENPLQFDPDRFLDNEFNQAFIPFSLGERSCLGLNFANQTFYTIYANIILNFKFHPAEKVTYEDEASLVIHPKNDNSFILKSRL